MFKSKLLVLASLSFFSFSSPPSPQKVEVLYYSLDKQSIPQLLSFYQLYPNSVKGKQALQDALSLLSPTGASEDLETALPNTNLGLASKLISTFSKPAESSDVTFSKEEMKLIRRISSHLPHNQLKGHSATTEEEVIKLPNDEIDIARAVLLSQGIEIDKIESFEAALDLMALQIQSRLSSFPTNQEVINEINSLLYDDLHFRFPPKSLYAKDIDQFTFLSSVLESRRGVCLGVSVLYLSLAQRLELPLESVTPPGHIYIRCPNDGNGEINIETTHRGIHIDTEQYLGVDTPSSHLRTPIEVIGLTHMNQAAVYWQKEMHEKAIASYRIAEKYIEDDYLLKQFLGLNLILAGKEKEGKKLLKEIRGVIPSHTLTSSTIVEDYLAGRVDAHGIGVAYQHVDQTRESILTKQKALQEVLEKYPEFRDGHFHLAITYLQLNRLKEGIASLENYHRLDQSNPTVEYYLSQLYMGRMDYKKAWKHLNRLESLLETKDHNPKVVQNLKTNLNYLYPLG